MGGGAHGVPKQYIMVDVMVYTIIHAILANCV